MNNRGGGGNSIVKLRQISLLTQKLSTPITEETSRRITALLFLLIVLVVFIHNCYTDETIQNIIDSGGVPPVFVENAFGRWVKLFITYGTARATVPLFFYVCSLFTGKEK